MTIDQVGRENCSGCSLCSLICKAKSITMQEDAEGFLQPVINRDTCIDCGACYKLCPSKEVDTTEKTPLFFSAVSKDKQLLKKSSSGGVFITLASFIIEQGGYVCGCVFNEDMVAVHICTNDMVEVKRMIGSKYVQSNISLCLLEVKRLLKEDRRVLFTGTACQVAAVQRYTNNPSNLYCVDILCHGVPSPLYFRKYVDYLQKKHRGKLSKIEFRNKDKRGWGSEHRTYYEIEKNGIAKGYRPAIPSYFCAFFWGLNLRESCYNCKFTGTSRNSDITIGDFWGSWNYFKQSFKEGISIVSINGDKGKELFAFVRDSFEQCYEIPIQNAKGSNTNFYHPTVKPSTRDGFYRGISMKSYEQMRSRVYLDKTSRKKILVSLYGLLMPEYIKRMKRALLK